MRRGTGPAASGPASNIEDAIKKKYRDRLYQDFRIGDELAAAVRDFSDAEARDFAESLAVMLENAQAGNIATQFVRNAAHNILEQYSLLRQLDGAVAIEARKLVARRLAPGSKKNVIINDQLFRILKATEPKEAVAKLQEIRNRLRTDGPFMDFAQDLFLPAFKPDAVRQRAGMDGQGGQHSAPASRELKATLPADVQRAVAEMEASVRLADRSPFFLPEEAVPHLKALDTATQLMVLSAANEGIKAGVARTPVFLCNYLRNLATRASDAVASNVPTPLVRRLLRLESSAAQQAGAGAGGGQQQRWSGTLFVRYQVIMPLARLPEEAARAVLDTVVSDLAQNFGCRPFGNHLAYFAGVCRAVAGRLPAHAAALEAASATIERSVSQSPPSAPRPGALAVSAPSSGSFESAGPASPSAASAGPAASSPVLPRDLSAEGILRALPPGVGESLARIEAARGPAGGSPGGPAESPRADTTLLRTLLEAGPDAELVAGVLAEMAGAGLAPDARSLRAHANSLVVRASNSAGMDEEPRPRGDLSVRLPPETIGRLRGAGREPALRALELLVGELSAAAVAEAPAAGWSPAPPPAASSTASSPSSPPPQRARPRAPAPAAASGQRGPWAAAAAAGASRGSDSLSPPAAPPVAPPPASSAAWPPLSATAPAAPAQWPVPQPAPVPAAESRSAPPGPAGAPASPARPAASGPAIPPSQGLPSSAAPAPAPSTGAPNPPPGFAPQPQQRAEAAPSAPAGPSHGGEAAELRALVEELRAQKKALEGEAAGLKQMLRQAHESEQALQTEVVGMRIEAGQLRGELDEARAERAALQHELNAAVASAQEAQAMLEEVSENARNAAASETAELHALHARIERLEEEKERLARELEASQRSCADLQLRFSSIAAFLPQATPAAIAIPYAPYPYGYGPGLPAAPPAWVHPAYGAQYPGGYGASVPLVWDHASQRYVPALPAAAAAAHAAQAGKGGPLAALLADARWQPGALCGQIAALASEGDEGAGIGSPPSLVPSLSPAEAAATGASLAITLVPCLSTSTVEQPHFDPNACRDAYNAVRAVGARAVQLVVMQDVGEEEAGRAAAHTFTLPEVPGMQAPDGRRVQAYRLLRNAQDGSLHEVPANRAAARALLRAAEAARPAQHPQQ
eukprot:tig00021127_g18774.t1